MSVEPDSTSALDVIDLLIARGADIDARNSHGHTPLLRATEMMSPESIMVFVDRGADLHAEDDSGMNLLHAFVALPTLHDPEVVPFLLERGFSPTEADDHGVTPFLHAAHGGDPAILRLLLEHGADPTARTSRGDNAVHMLALGSRWGTIDTPAPPAPPDALRLLLDAGLDVNEPDGEGFTALHLAVQGGDSRMVAVLLDAGADRSATDGEGLTPIDLAREVGFERVIEILGEAPGEG
jgi:ankyrin repeat protein